MPGRPGGGAPFPAILLAASLAAGCSALGPAELRAKAGSIDYEIGKGPIFLVGEWERHGLPADGAEARYAESTLRSAPYESAQAAPGTVEYRMSVNLYESANAGLRRMSLYIPGIAGFEAAYIDGRIVYDAASEPDPSPIFPFTSGGHQVDVILRSGPGGTRLETASIAPHIVLFGEAGEVERFQDLAIGAAVSEVGFFHLLGLITFLLYLFWRKNREFLGFAVYMFAVGFFYAFKNAVGFRLAPGAFGLWRVGPAYTAALALQYLALVCS